jgi:hypothetical protein
MMMKMMFENLHFSSGFCLKICIFLDEFMMKKMNNRMEEDEEDLHLFFFPFLSFVFFVSQLTEYNVFCYKWTERTIMTNRHIIKGLK